MFFIQKWALMLMANYEMEYMYRDASNYKFWGCVILQGPFSIGKIQEYLIDGEFFVPQKVSLLSLVPQQRNEDDHDWHSLCSIEPTKKRKFRLSSRDLIEKFRIAHLTGWEL